MSDSWLGLEGKVIVVTGGSSGIGSHIVGQLLGCGAIVVNYDTQITEEHEGNQNLLMVQGDIIRSADVRAMIKQALKRCGRIDGLVNNAAVTRVKMLVDYYHHDRAREYNMRDIDYVFNVNVKGTFLITQLVAAVMVKQAAGAIVNVSSEAGMEGSRGQSVYAASKGAINALTLSWAKELGMHNVRVLAVAPGINEPTPMGQGSHLDELAYTRGCTRADLDPDYAKVIPLGRRGRLEEIANLVSFLLSDRASYLTGTIVNVTGGKSRG